ncbi:response regulator [Adhaeribacter terreus]|uniref:Response regulator n=1 Tax=Adhaeribacter terreus TaxID=529703 RepID=A0ABW0EDJ7_9BACT
MILENGFNIEIAGNGREALDKLQTRQFDLILMDVEMPEMDGYTATELIRKHLPELSIPIIIITMQNEIAQEAKSLLLGANTFLKKPFTAEELLSEIQTLIL